MIFKFLRDFGPARQPGRSIESRIEKRGLFAKDWTLRRGRPRPALFQPCIFTDIRRGYSLRPKAEPYVTLRERVAWPALIKLREARGVRGPFLEQGYSYVVSEGIQCRATDTLATRRPRNSPQMA